MKKMKKIFALLIAMVMVLGMSTSVFAQTVDSNKGGSAKITISNAANGETYKVAKLFDASVTGTEDGSVRYEGNIPTALTSYFTKDTAGNISATGALDLSDSTVQSALKTWAEANVTASAVSDGSILEFTNLEYGYYVITTTQGETLLTVDTTNPNATVIDKNTTPPVSELTKTVDGKDEVVSIGDVVTYTVTFKTSNYYKANETADPEQIVKYTIEDTLPAFLSQVNVTSIIVDNDADTKTTGDQTNVTAQFTNKKIELTWAENGTSKYANGALVTVVYTAKITDSIVAGNVKDNKNTVTITPITGKGDVAPYTQTKDKTINTYAAALQKTDENNADLAGATFQVPGLTVKGSEGNYTVVSYDPKSTVAGTIMECDDTGFLAIRGISNEAKIMITEVAAPDGYNKLTAPQILPVTITSTATTVTTEYYDAEGNKVDEATETTTTQIATNDDLVKNAVTIVNQKGAELPSTGGIGTTIFYIIGAILVIGAGVVLVTRRRMNAN